MTQVEGIPYRRHGPSAAVQDFLEPLLPGVYFDCGRARLHGVDDALLDEARRRGREIGDDTFQLVACEMGLIFCRPSISFAISAPWDELELVRPQGRDPVQLFVEWPKHGSLTFTVSRRLGSNIFRRWLQLQMQSSEHARRSHPSDPFGVQVDVLNGPDTTEPQGSVSALPETVFEDTAIEDTALKEAALKDTVLQDMAPRPVPESRSGSELPRRSLLETESHPEAASELGTEIADDELRRLVPPRPYTHVASTSWVGSPVSLAAALVVLSSVVLVVAVVVGLNRRDGITDASADPAGPLAGSLEPFVTIDHQRFNPDSEIPGDPESSDESHRSLDPDDLANEGQVQLEPTGSARDLSVAAPESPATTVRPEGEGEPLVMTQPGGAEGALRCDGNYSGCVPPVAGLVAAPGVDLDVDCDGRGDGPWMMVGEVLVLGSDIYGLDTDGDGVACEADQPDDRDAEATD